MKIILKGLLGIIAVIYVAIALILTIFLLNYNEYNLTVLGDKTFLIVRDNNLEPNYKKGDLVIVKKNANADIVADDEIFFYNAYENEVSVNYGKVLSSQNVNEKESTYTMEGNLKISSKYVIGKAETSKKYENWGTVLSIMESKIGFLIIIILPILLMFLYEIYVVIMEVKRPINARR